MSIGLRNGTNNFAELLSLKFLMIFASEVGCRSLNIFGDAMNAIHWAMGTQLCLNTRLSFILEDISTLRN